MTGVVAAIDLGASSGRVILGYVNHNELRLTPVARFPNNPVRTIDGLHWDVLDLYRNAVHGLAAAVRQDPEVASVAVDAWAVDYALLRQGAMLGNPYHYRDDRNVAGVTATHAIVGGDELYGRNGLQHLPFNTLFQFAADKASGMLDLADGFLLIPDLINYWLSGVQAAESTNASTTGLLGVTDHRWDDSLIERLGLPRSIFPELVEAGTSIGPLLPGVAAEVGGKLTVSTVGSHDTASAVAAIPALDADFAYISCGTWALVGVETEHAVLTEAGRAANFTNEGGVDGRVRYLHNVMGLWLLSESVRTWERSGETIDLPRLIAEAAALTGPVSVFDPNDDSFLPPGDMPGRIAAWLTARGLAVPSTRAEFARSIIESLALAFAESTVVAGELSGKTIKAIHIVGGGSLNELLCQLTADRSGLPVLAGPVEATALGNVLIQARAKGMVSGDLESLRAIVVAAFEPRRYLPRSSRG